jgi:O-methyltransferase
MNLLNIIKKNLFIQNIFSSLISLYPEYLHFTTGKYFAIKKAMYITAHDETYGNYVEFGVFTGSSFNSAMKTNKRIEKIFGDSNCEFFGFDSFAGFGTTGNEDKHPRFLDETFSVNLKKIKENIKKCSKGQKYKIVEGFFDKTLFKKTPSNYGITKARVIMIDCDMKEPTLLALNFIRDALQPGTIILFDDYIFYKGSKTKGEFSAFKEFQDQNPNIEFRSAFEYGYGSKAFIVSNITN